MISPVTTLVPGRWRVAALLAGCLAALGAAIVLGVAIGAIYIPPLAVIDLTLAQIIPHATPYPDTWKTILFDIRLPRVAITALIGASLIGLHLSGLVPHPLGRSVSRRRGFGCRVGRYPGNCLQSA